MDGVKSYSEMSMEELEKALDSAEFRAKSEKKFLDRTEFFTSAYSAQKAEYDEAVGEVNEIKSEIFGRNQEASLSRLNDKSRAALEEYYQFQTEGPGTAKTVMTFFGIYDGNARQMDRNNLKENVVSALEEQGISGDEFDSIYEYYRFERDEIRATEKAADTVAAYENGSGLERFAMNAGTVLNAPVRGLAASTEALVSLSYEDPYAPLNVNAPSFDMTNYTDTVRTETLQDIDSDAGKFIYRTGMSVADFSTTIPLTMATGGGGAALTVMGANAGTSAAKNATLSGASKEQALKMGVTSAAIEVATEKLPLDNMMSIAKNGGKVSVNLAKQAGIEGAEEVIAEAGNTLADIHINGVNSEFSQSVQAYIGEGMTPEDARTMATRDVFKNMGEAGLGGVMSGGLIGSGAQITGNVMTNGGVLSTVPESINGYSLDADSVWRYKTDPSRDAWGWQGGDTFAGKDNYETIVLEGSKKDIYLVKLEGSNSGYFTTLEAYNKLRDADGKVSAVTLSEGLQVAPWKNRNTGQCEYRTQVAIYKLESDMEVALGEQTLANNQYGVGKLPQIYIPGYDGRNQANNDAIGLKKKELENLKDSVISEAQYMEIQDKNKYQIAKRDMFLMQSTKDEVLQLQKESTDVAVQQKCQEYLDILNSEIKKQQARLDGYKADMGELPSQTYDDVNKYLGEKHSGSATVQDDMEIKVTEVRDDLMRQIQSSIRTDVHYRDIELNDNIQTVYDADNFCTREQEKIAELLKTDKTLAGPSVGMIDLTPKKIDLTTDPKLAIIKINGKLEVTGADAVKPLEKAVAAAKTVDVTR